jgi:hypothetical protein
VHVEVAPLPVVENEPAGQLEQLLAPFEEYVPAAHGVHTAVPLVAFAKLGLEKEPAAHRPAHVLDE